MVETTHSADPVDASGSGSDASDATNAQTPDESPSLWGRLRPWAVAVPGRSTLLAALVLGLLQLGVRGYLKASGWFLADDFAFIQRALDHDMWDPAYLFEPYQSHLMPGSFAWMHVLVDRWPLDYTPIVVSDLVLQALCNVAMWALLTSLVGRRPAVLVPYAVYLFSVLTLPGFLWWAASVNQLPGQLALLVALWCQVRYHRTGRTLWGLAGALSLALGLLFWEKLLMGLPVIGALTVLFFTTGTVTSRLSTTVRRDWRVWAAYLVVCATHLVAYLAIAPTPLRASSSPVSIPRSVGHSVGEAVLPALVGGPFTWQPYAIGAIAAPGTGAMITALLVVLGLATLAVLRRHGAWRGLAVAAAYVLVLSALVARTRSQVFGTDIAREYRYFTDAAPVVVVFATLAVLPIAGSARRGSIARLLPRAGGLPRLLSGWETSAAALATVAVTAAALVSTLGFEPAWRNDVTPRFFAVARADLAAADRPIDMADLALPRAASRPGLPTLSGSSRLLEGARPRPRLLTPGRSAETLFGLDDDGHVRRLAVDPTVGLAAQIGPDGDCGWRVGDRAVTIPLRGTTQPWVWLTRIGYMATMDADTVVRVGETSTPVQIHSGVHELWVIGEGPIDRVTIGALTYGALCTSDVWVGAARPIPGSTP